MVAMFLRSCIITCYHNSSLIDAAKNVAVGEGATMLFHCDLLIAANFARKSGPQMAAVKAMVDRLSGNTIMTPATLQGPAGVN
ncbi:MAG: hypothetical protein WBN66_08805 [Smithella sp.]